MSISAVITADIVNSTGLSKAEEKKLMKSLSAALQSYQHEFFRGDSFQVYLRAPEEAVQLVLQLRTIAMKISTEGSMPASDIKASIGIGPVKLPIKTLTTAGGEAFILSGRSFDEMKTEQRLRIKCQEADTKTNLGLGIIAEFIDYLFQRMTNKQAAVVSELLQKRTQIETAKKLKKSQATVHKHIQSAGWPEIEKLLTAYKNLVALIQS